MKLVIFGAGGLGGVVLDTLRQMGGRDVVGYLDSDAALQGRLVNDVCVLGGFEQIPALLQQDVLHAVVAIGINVDRVRVAKRLVELGMSLTSAIHPLARVAKTAKLGEHVILGPRVSVCVHAGIGSHVVISAGAIVDHDNVLEDGVFVHSAARLAGGVRVGEMATVGIGASVIPGKRIGPRARVEAGAVVIRDVPSGAAVAGVPAVETTKRGEFIVS